MRALNIFESLICRYTGELLCRAKREGYDIVDFTEKYMNSKVAAQLDKADYLYAGSGPYYLLEEVLDEITPIPDSGVNARYGDGVVEWVGWTYREWNWCTGESSKEIVRICPAQKMFNSWLYGHTVALEIFIEDMKGWDPKTIL